MQISFSVLGPNQVLKLEFLFSLIYIIYICDSQSGFPSAYKPSTETHFI